MNIIDISWPISAQMTAYKDVRTVQFIPTKIMERDGVRQATITMSTHTGTHVDAPSHFLANGATIDTLALSSVIGRCTVIDLTNVSEKISAHILKECALTKHDIVLFKTTNSFCAPEDPFNSTFVYLDESAAQFLVHQKIKAVGIDYLGIERNQPQHETHTILMRNNIAIIEGLRLAQVSAGDYFFVCLPLLLKGLDGAPARAVLIQDF